MKRVLFIVAAVVGIALSVWATFVYPRVCVCGMRDLNLWCFKCRHFAYQCPRYWPSNEFGQKVVPFRPSCVITRPSGICPTCGVNRVSIIEGGR